MIDTTSDTTEDMFSSSSRCGMGKEGAVLVRSISLGNLWHFDNTYIRSVTEILIS